MKKILLVLLVTIFIAGCQKDKIKPVTLGSYRLVRAIEKDPDGKINRDQTFAYDDSSRLVKSREVNGTDVFNREYMYDEATGDLLKMVEKANIHNSNEITTYTINYDNLGSPLSADVETQSTSQFNSLLLFTVKDSKVVSARYSGSNSVDTVVYEGNNIVWRSQMAGDAEMYTYGTRRGFFNFNFKWFLSDITPMPFENEVKAYHSVSADRGNLDFTYKYDYDLKGYPVKAYVTDGTFTATAEFIYETAK